MPPIHPYHIAVPHTKIERLHQKLNLSDLPDELEDAGWAYGAPLADVRRIAEYWKTSYRWEDTEAQMNALPNFITTLEIEGFDPVDVHFLHRKSPVKNAIPLLFVHGCEIQIHFNRYVRKC